MGKKKDKMSFSDDKISISRLSAIISFLDRNKGDIKIREFIVVPRGWKCKWFSMKLKFTYPHEDESYKYGIRARFNDVIGLTHLEDKGELMEEEGGKSDEQEEETDKIEEGE